MKLPDFDAFLKSIDQEAFGAYLNDSAEKQIIYAENLFAEGNPDTLVNLLYQQFIQDATRICLAHLFAYHSWIQRQFDQEV